MRSHIVLKICKKRGLDQRVSKASDETRKSADATVTKQVVGQPQLFWEPYFLQQKTDSGLSQPLPPPRGTAVVGRTLGLATKTKWTLFFPGKRRS